MSQGPFDPSQRPFPPLGTTKKLQKTNAKRAACNAFEKQLHLVVNAKGQSIENNYFFLPSI
jgi:hypothetical protein